jgi:tripartite ATP-independent transporter DctM subunit
VTTAILFVAFLGLMFLGIPVVAALAAASLVGLWFISDIPVVSLVQTAVFGVDKFVLLAIPLFVLTGELMNASGISQRLFDLAAAMVGHLRGGLGQVNVVANLFIGGISGSSSAEAALTTKILMPSMVARGYSPGFSGAVTAASAMLGPIIPPSIAMILYGSVANVSIGRLFVAGVVPGLMVGLVLCLTVWYVSVRRGYRGEEKRASWAEIGRRTLDALLALLLPVFVLGVMWFGVVTPTEAGAIAAAYAAIVGSFIYKAIPLRAYGRILLDTAVDTGVILLIVAVSASFTFLLTLLEVPQQIAREIAAAGNSAVLFLILVNIALLLAGMLMEATALLLLTSPILVPIALKLGIDPVHFGLMMIVNIMIGTLTPPFGQSVFIVSVVGKVPAEAIFKEIMWLLPGLGAVLAVVTFWPQSFMWLVRMVAP